MKIRSTFHGRIQQMQAQAAELGAALGTAQSEAITGKKVSFASDAPATSRLVRRAQAQLERQTVWQDNADMALSYLDQADSSLQDMADVLGDAKTLAVQLSNGSYSAEERTAAAEEAAALLERAVGIGNTQVGGRYIFGGTAYDAAPFDAAGTYTGSGDVPTIRVGEGQSVRAGMVGDDVFARDVDTFAVLAELRDALAADDPDRVSATLTDLEAALDQLGEPLAIVGTETNRALDAQELAANMEIELNGQLSSLTEADAVEAYTRVNELSTAFEAALSVIGQFSQGGLFSRM